MAMIGLTILGSLVVIYMLSKLSNKNLTELTPSQADNIEDCTFKAHEFLNQDTGSNPRQHGNGQSQGRPSQYLYNYQDEHVGAALWAPAGDKSVNAKVLDRIVKRDKERRLAKEMTRMEEINDIKEGQSRLRIQQNRQAHQKRKTEQENHHVQNIAQKEADKTIHESNCEKDESLKKLQTKVHIAQYDCNGTAVVNTEKAVTAVVNGVKKSTSMDDSNESKVLVECSKCDGKRCDGGFYCVFGEYNDHSL